MIPPARSVLVAVPKADRFYDGTVSSSILTPATYNTPQQIPKINLPMQMDGKLRNWVKTNARAEIILKIIRARLLPY